MLYEREKARISELDYSIRFSGTLSVLFLSQVAGAYCLTSGLVPCALHAVKEHQRAPTLPYTPRRAGRVLVLCEHNRGSLNETRANRASQGRGGDHDDDDGALTSESARRRHTRTTLLLLATTKRR